MNPTPTSAYVSPLLTDIALAFMQDDSQFIADSVFPNVPVTLPAGTYFTYDRADWNRSDAQLRGPGSPSAGTGWRMSTDTYSTKVYAVHKDIDDQTRAVQQNFTNLDATAARFVMRHLLLKREKDFIAKYFGASIWTTERTGVASGATGTQFNQWNSSTSTPIEDVNSTILTMTTLTGYRPNKLVLGPQVFLALHNHPEILDRIKYTQEGIVTTDLLAGLFGVDQVLVPFATENTAKEGDTAAYAMLYGKSAMLVYAPDQPSIDEPSAGYTFSWAGYMGTDNPNGVAVVSFRQEELRSDRVEGEMAYDQKLVSADMGAFFATAVA